MLAPQAILADRVAFRLRSLDRLYLNLYQPRLQTSEQLRAFLCGVRGYPIASPALFGQIGRDFSARVERFAATEGVELVAFPRGADKEDIADGYFARRPERQGVIFIGVAQERARSWWGTVRRSAQGLDCAFARRTVAVKHYYFYLRDPAWGRAFIKLCTYVPFAGRLYLNGHSWLKCQLDRRGIAFTELDNGLLACADPGLAQRLADRLGASDIDGFLRRWLAYLPLPFTSGDEEAGYRYRPSLWQMELSDTFAFARPRDGRLWFEHAIRGQLDLGRPERVQLIFGRRVTRSTPGIFRTRLITEGVDPSIEFGYRRSKAKAYFKLGRALRIETTINDTHDLGLGRSLSNLPELRHRMHTINTTFLAALAERAVPIAPAATLEQVVLPTRTDQGEQAAALRFGDPRVMALWSALCCVTLLPAGFSNKVLRALVAPLLGAPLADYSARRMSYDLRRLVRKQVIARVAGTHRYVLTEDGRRLALTFAGTYRRIVLPVLGEFAPAANTTARPLARAWCRLARELDRFIDGVAA